MEHDELVTSKGKEQRKKQKHKRLPEKL